MKNPNPFFGTRFLFRIVFISALLISLASNPQGVKAQLSFPAEINKEFSPISIPSGGISRLSITIFNPNSFSLTNAAWADNLIGVQPGIFIATPVNLTNTCGGTAVAPAGGTALSLTGGSVPAQVGVTPGACTVSVDVTSTTPGNLINTIPAGGLTGTGGGGTITNTTPASATLQVAAVQPPLIGKLFTPNTMWVGQTSQLSIAINNIDPSTSLTQTTLTDNLPANVVIAAPPAATANGCGPATLTAVSGSGSITLNNATITPGAVCFITVNVTSTVGGVYVNTIPPGAIQTNEGVTNQGQAVAPLNVQGVGLAKSFSPPTFEAGGISTLTITIQNPAGSPLTGVNLSDTLPGTVLTVVPGSAATTCGAGVASTTLPRTVTLTGGTVPAGNTTTPGTCTITVQVTTPPGATAGTFTNTIPAGALTTTLGITNVLPASAPVTIYAAGAGVGAQKSFVPATIQPGGNSRLRITITAPADKNLTNFSITDNLPANVTISNSTAPTRSANCGAASILTAVTGGTSISLTNGNILAGTTCQIDVYVTSSVSGVYTNTINPANVTNAEGQTLPGPITANLTVQPLSNLAVSKLFTPDTVSPNGISLLTITLTNTNASPLVNVSLLDTLPGDTTNGVVIAPTPNAATTCGSGVVTATPGTLNISMIGGTIPAQSGGVPGLCTVTVYVQGRGISPSLRTNIIPVANVIGTIQGTTTTMNPIANATAPFTITDLSIGVVKGFNPLTVFGGSASTMSVQLVNPNNADLVGIAFTDNMPAGMIIANPANPSVGTCSGAITATPGNGFFSFSGGSLPPLGTCTLTLNITMTVNGNLTNTIPAGAVTTTNGASNPQPAEASLTNLPGASVSKSFSPNPINVGEYSLLTITIQNTGNIPLTGMGLSDNLPGALPAGLAIAGAPAPAPVNNCDGTLTAVAGSQFIQLASGTLAASASCTIVIAVTGDTPGSYQNIIPAGNLTSNEGATNNTPATDTLVVLGGATTASIGNYVWNDTDADGIQDASETGIGGVTVNLYSSTGTLIGTTTTTAGGFYQFTGLTPGDYYVEFVPPAGYIVSPQDQGGNDATDSDANPVNGQTIITTLTAGENDLTWDAGLYQPASLGDTVWSDLNRNGVQDGGAETGIDGVTVNLYRPGYGPDGIPGNADDGNIVATTTTAGGGLYLFDNLIPGDYYVDFIPPAGYVLSPQDQGGNDATDSDANPANGQTILTTLTSGENDLTWDAGLYQSASLGDFVWNDLDADGVQDATEIGIDGVTVNLYSSTGTLIATTTTSGGGFYLFTNLAPGDYYVDFIPPAGYVISPQDQGGNDTADSDANPVNGQTIITTITPGENDLTWDAGLYQPASLGDFVWNDVNANGIQDGTETGINGVIVNLYRPGYGPDGIPGNADDNAIVATTTTAGGGLYLFDNLTPGGYYVDFIPPAGYVISPQDQGVNDATDSDANPANGQTIVTTLTAGENDLTWDAGLYQPASLGDTVWSDLNANGVQDGGAETGINGVTVNLYRPGYGPDGIPGNADDANIVATTTTAGGGLYLFDNLIPGNYYVDFIPPAGYVLSPQDQGGNDAADSDANPVNGQTVVTTLTPGENDLTWDAGLYQSASLGDFVWNDANANGIQDGTETGIDGVTVNLYSSSGTLIATTTTTAGGFYLFTGLTPGDYYVDFIPPAGYVISPQDQGGNDGTDSDANPANGQTIVTTITAGENDLTWDAGLYQPASLGDTVWSDLNANGIQDGGAEAGIDGVTVNLYSSNGTLIATTTTANGGLYLFDNLIPGDYYVDFIPPAGYVLSPQDQGGNDAADSDANPTTGQTIVTTLTAGENDLTWDAGLYQPASLGDFVWNDANANGIQDAGEVGIGNVTVELYNSAGVLQATTVTNASGAYLFTGLTPGDYYVRFITPGGYTISPQDQGGNDTGDSDPNPATGQTVTTTLVPGENDLTWDAGLYQPASLGNYVWNDADADGVQDATETGIDGVTVNLYSSTGTLIATTTTAGGGLYLFDNLVPGAYYVDFVPPAGYTLSPQDQSGNDATDSDANTTTGETIVTTLVPGENDLTWDAGLYLPASLGNYVWNDADADGVQDATEAGINGVTVNLYSSNGTLIATTTTAGGGLYLFDNLVPGDYYVDFVPPAGYTVSPQDQGGNDATDSDANTTTGETIVTTLVPGENDLTWDAGLYQPASLGNYVWSDADADGVQDATEAGIDGVTVNLYSSTGVLIATTTTANGGLYLFDNLVPGDYYVDFVPPAGYTVSPQDQGGNDTTDSDANTTTGETVVTTLVPGENDLTWDAGLYQLASLGNYVWNDADLDGIQDPTETGIDGVTVNLYSSTGVLIATTTTSGGGAYLFTGLTPGDYYVDFVPPVGYSFSPQDQGGNDATDSDANPLNGQTIVTTLVAGENDLTWDAGLYLSTATIGNYVWNDTDADGIQDSTETGINGVTVNLYSSTGTLIATTTTSGGGLYLFDNLDPGDYFVEFVPPVGYVFSPQDQGGNDATDSDANSANGRTITTTLTAGENDLTWDAGLHLPPVPTGLTKTISATNLPSTTGTNTAIGEIVTYQVTVTIPPGTFDNATLVDNMERGLAFVACDSITAPGLTTSVAGSFTSVCSNAVTSDAGGGTPADVDRRVTYDFETLTNAGQTDATVTVTYRAIVLDIAVNINGNVLNNSVTWSWSGGSIGPAQTTVTIVEPQLTIIKTSNVNFIANGSEATFTLTVSHTPASNSDAFDVVVTDILPTGLSYIANSLDCTVGAQDPDVSCVFDNSNPAQPTLRAEWSVFIRNGGTGQIRFRVAGNASLPQGGVTNTANVEWTSMPGDQTTPQSSTPNVYSTERYYDPGDAINIYGASSSRTLTQVTGGGGGGGGNNNNNPPNQGGFLIPLTGFAPNAVTELDSAKRPAYGPTLLTIEIPSIKVNAPVVGIQLKAGSWDVSWLANQAGWLEGTAYPTWSGNSVITAHVVNADGKPGLFARLNKVRIGDYIFLYQSGYRYTYQIVSNKYVRPDDITVLKHEEKAYITLITCDDYDEETMTYLRRSVVRAVLIDVSTVK